ncbi:hypothetical protein [Tenacibaculum halocynthiae]|uniref:hypothetical protein n=1 Tax=Tenacibaculum halocynthiae TaxID=1254437 RepID=UPI003D661F44
MKKKLVASIAVILLFTSFGYSQKVRFKKGKVIVDKKEILSYEKNGFLGSEITLYSLDGENEIAEMFHERNGTNSYQEDDYKKLFFTNEEIKIESGRIKFRGWKYVIKLLIRNKVLGMDGKINLAKLKKFAKKYDENITNRTVRY